MFAPRNLALLVLLLGLAVAGLGIVQLWYQAGELEARALAAEARFAALRKNAAADRARAQELKLKLEAAEATAARQLQALASDKPAGNASDPKRAGAKEDRLNRWIADASNPDVVRRLELQARRQTLDFFGPMFDRLHLDSAKRDQLVTLLAAKREAPLDVAVSDFQNGVDPREDPTSYYDMIAATRKDLESQIHGLLGDADYSSYANYTLTSSQSNVLGNLTSLMNAAQAPLTPEQQMRLTASMQANNSARVSAAMIADAKQYLTPVQLQALKDFRAIQQANSARRDNPVQALPVTRSGN